MWTMNECLTTPQHKNQIGYWVSEKGKGNNKNNNNNNNNKQLTTDLYHLLTKQSPV